MKIEIKTSSMRQIEHNADLCIVGGALGRSGHVVGTWIMGVVVTGNAYAYANLTTDSDPSGQVGSLVGHAR